MSKVKLNQMDLAILDFLSGKPATVSQINKFYRQECSPNILKLLEADKIKFANGKYERNEPSNTTYLKEWP